MKRALLLFLTFLFLSAQVTAQVPGEASLSNVLDNPEGAIDRLVFFDTPEAWDAGETDRLALVTPGGRARLVLDDDRDRFPRRGSWTSPEFETDFPFTEMIPSWNAETPEDNTGIQVDARVRDAETGEWSPWLYFGRWGETLATPYRRIRFDKGIVHVDVLKLDAPADAFQVRARLYAFDFGQGANPSLRRVAVSYSGVVDDPVRRARLTEPVEVPAGWARDLGIPFTPQGDGPSCINGSICSPTSVSMVLHHWGENRGLVDNALAIYDPDYGIFGNWSRATALAGELGYDAWVMRIRNWDQAKAKIASGVPIIASIRFREGEFPSAVFDASGGHLIVIRGFTPEGDAIVNDPANRDEGDGAVYKAEELARAWFDKGGVAYIISPAPFEASR